MAFEKILALALLVASCQCQEIFDQSGRLRITRQLHGSMNTNPDGGLNLNAKLPLAGNDKNMLSAIGSVSGNRDGGLARATGGLAFDNVNGHGVSLTKTHIPSFGDQLTAAGRLGLVHTDNHQLTANAFATHTQPKIPNLPDFNTHGGSLDYMYKGKVGGSLGMSHTDLFKKTDYSAMANVNLFKNPSSSLDFSAGASRSISPYIPNSNWQPSAGLTYTKYW